ncbi:MULTISPECIES: hypothetical protein [Salegentibacter]|uniref:Lipoprotein n=1 Tax=Salegentibacter agarivorans TaxID=345907 RepID=A0A1I2M110_9FLAO|nr:MULTISPECIES: hypothetical protein [Salegentibacter]APS40711.1 hypothetical protein AO058_04690 [Salegentibacter sp. T436]SFF85124.1 hypothetical protein SAMN04488033_11166 [Salegentibacter agarivorans]
MKKLLFLFSSIFALTLITGCGSNKELQERAPAQFQGIYYTQGENGLDLHIPVAVIQDNRVNLKSVYFRGMKSPLVQDSEQTNLFIANFGTNGMDIMSSDPAEENKNRVPQKTEQMPFEIEDDEAILVFSQNEKTKYYKLTGIQEQN